jgi:putative transposase
MAFSSELLDHLLAGCERPEDILGPQGLFAQLKKALAERALGAELGHHLAAEARTPTLPESGRRRRNHRNGSSPKTVLTDTGAVTVAIPRDRAGTFEPQLIPKLQRRLPGFDAKVLALYARGLTVREMQAHLTELYGVDVSPDLISTVTDAVLEEVTDWQQRPLLPLYPVIFFDALRVRIRDEGTVRAKAVYLALGVAPDGTKDVLGLWIEQTEGAKFWLRVMTELKRPAHPRRRGTVEGARVALEAFSASEWGRKYPPIAPAWRRHWEQVIPLFAHPPRSGGCSTPRMRSRACTCSCARRSRSAAISRPTRRRPS